jgi:Fic family protein
LTLRQLAARPLNLPVATSWLLAGLGEAKGRQDLHYKREPEQLRTLRQHALVESAISSNRIEGVVISQARLQQVVLGQDRLTDRDEQEVRGYREALTWIHDHHATIPVSVETILRLHFLSHGQTGDAGQFKTRDSDIAEKYPDGRSRIRFHTVSAAQTAARTADFISAWADCLRERWAPPPIALAAVNLDFLGIHPFRDGNGRVSRLLLLLMAYHLGFEVGRYLSLERLIEQSKDRYYETLEMSSVGWHENANDLWPYANFILTTLKSAYSELEGRLVSTPAIRGSKTSLIQQTVAGKITPFTLTELERDCPTVSRDLIRRVLAELRAQGTIESIGRGPGAVWRKRV